MLALMNNSRESFEVNMRGSFERGSIVEDQRFQSFKESMIQPGNTSITENHMLHQRDENSIEEYEMEDEFDDGIP